LLHDLGISNPGWEACKMHDPTGHRRPPGKFRIHGIYGRVLTEGRSLIVNDPSTHPDRIGLPPGHPPLTSFLGVPLLREGKTVGMLAVGNREGGYRSEDQQILEAITPAIIEALDRKRAERRLTADLVGLTRMHALSCRALETGGFEPLLQEVMDAAVAIMGAEKGTFQLLEADSLRIVAHCGHRPEFLEFFAAAENVASVCGEATKRGERVVVADVEESPLFVGTASLPVFRAAGVRAVQSTPVVTRTGGLLGILTTHWSMPHVPDEHDLLRIDLLASQAADLIEFARAQAAVRESEALRRAVTENSPDAIYVKDCESRWLMGNPEVLRIVGKTAEQALGKTDLELYADPAIGRAILENDRRILASGQAATFEESADTPEGRRTFLSTKAPLRDAQGNITGIIGISRDITERKRVEEELRTRNAELTEFNELMVDRELRMIELKKEINRLCEEAGQPVRYDVLEEGPV
jgi:PAS domain S-box-containing protein